MGNTTNPLTLTLSKYVEPSLFHLASYATAGVFSSFLFFPLVLGATTFSVQAACGRSGASGGRRGFTASFQRPSKVANARLAVSPKTSALERGNADFSPSVSVVCRVDFQCWGVGALTSATHATSRHGGLAQLPQMMTDDPLTKSRDGSGNIDSPQAVFAATPKLSLNPGRVDCPSWIGHPVFQSPLIPTENTHSGSAISGNTQLSTAPAM